MICVYHFKAQIYTLNCDETLYAFKDTLSVRYSRQVERGIY